MIETETLEPSLLKEEAVSYNANKDIPQDIAYQSLGQLFVQAREYHKLSIEDVAKKLCLTEDKIKAIETDRLQVFDAPIYARGYVETYAKLVGIPKELWQPMISKLGYQTAPKNNIRQVKPIKIKKSIANLNASNAFKRQSRQKQKPLWIAAGVLVIILGAISWWSLLPSANSVTASNNAQSIPLKINQGS